MLSSRGSRPWFYMIQLCVILTSWITYSCSVRVALVKQRDPCDISVVNDPEYRILDSAITATTTHAHCTAQSARRMDTATGDHDGWCSAESTDPNDYLTYDLGAVRRVTALRTRSRGAVNYQYVTSFKVIYWNVGQSEWTGILDENGNNMTFTGNDGIASFATAVLPGDGIYTTQIRFYPLSYSAHKSTRLDVMGC